MLAKPVVKVVSNAPLLGIADFEQPRFQFASLFGVLLRAANRQFELGADQADAQPFDAKQTQLWRLIGPAEGELLEGLHEEVKVAKRRERRREQTWAQSSEPGRHHHSDEEEKRRRVLARNRDQQ